VSAQVLFQAGELDGAIERLGADLRANPMDVRGRTFLFELLCFAGQYDRAEKQLDVIAGANKEAEMGAMLYRSALHAERDRQAMFEKNEGMAGDGGKPPIAGMFNGQAFASMEDADPRIGARLELFAAGQYTWIPLEHVSQVVMEPPKRLRDLLWAPARVQTGPDFEGLELGEVLLPVLAPLSWKSSDPAVRLGRSTDWVELADGRTVPVGQRLFVIDDEAVPILELRDLEISAAGDAEG
jgi:type VI secretion system protein ImpE